MTRPDRQGMKIVQATVTREKWKQLRNIVTHTERTATDLLTEAIDMLAEKYGEPPPPARKTSRRDRSPT